MYYAKHFIQKIIAPKFRVALKKQIRRTKNKLLNSKNKKTTLQDFRNLLTIDFNIKSGDTIIVSSSFGNLNSDFSPKDLIILLQTLVGREGNIVMPFYPPGNSYEWAEKKEIFDMKTTLSSTGILTQVFSEMEEVYKSKHPIKAVCAWGYNSKEITLDHENSTTPYFWDSPYGWLIKNPSKSLGLGLKNIPIFHACEDIFWGPGHFLYQEKKTLEIRNYDGSLSKISTYVHDPHALHRLEEAGNYVKKLNLISYRKTNIGHSFCYVVNNQELFEACQLDFSEGNFRYKK